MARPTPHATTERLYERLPEHYRTADARQDGPDWPLLRYLSLVGDQAGEVEDLLDRIDYVPPEEGGDPGDTSDLVDAAEASPTWLPWLAQLVGLELDTSESLATQRARITGVEPTWQTGSREALEAAVAAQLTGTQTVTITAHYGGNIWVIGVGTVEAETPQATWRSIANAAGAPDPEADPPTWRDLAEWSTGGAFVEGDDGTLPDYSDLQTGPTILVADVVAQKPAGTRLEHYYTA